MEKFIIYVITYTCVWQLILLIKTSLLFSWGSGMEELWQVWDNNSDMCKAVHVWFNQLYQLCLCVLFAAAHFLQSSTKLIVLSVCAGLTAEESAWLQLWKKCIGGNPNVMAWYRCRCRVIQPLKMCSSNHTLPAGLSVMPPAFLFQHY